MATSAKKKAASKSKQFLGYNIPGGSIIKVVGENPRRKDSEVYKQYELMKKAKTVDAFLAKGGRRRWLPGAQRRGFIRINRR